MISRKNGFKLLFVAGVVFIASMMAGCGSSSNSNSGSWNMPTPEKTGIDPAVGGYAIDSGNCFSVVEEAGEKYVLFSNDCYRFDKIKVENGAFSNEWGEIDGDHCPSDSYAIAGSFSSETYASGTIKYAYDCEITEEVKFIAELK